MDPTKFPPLAMNTFDNEVEKNNNDLLEQQKSHQSGKSSNSSKVNSPTTVENNYETTKILDAVVAASSPSNSNNGFNTMVPSGDNSTSVGTNIQNFSNNASLSAIISQNHHHHQSSSTHSNNNSLHLAPPLPHSPHPSVSNSSTLPSTTTTTTTSIHNYAPSPNTNFTSNNTSNNVSPQKSAWNLQIANEVAATACGRNNSNNNNNNPNMSSSSSSSFASATSPYHSTSDGPSSGMYSGDGYGGEAVPRRIKKKPPPLHNVLNSIPNRAEPAAVNDNDNGNLNNNNNNNNAEVAPCSGNAVNNSNNGDVLPKQEKEQFSPPLQHQKNTSENNITPPFQSCSFPPGIGLLPASVLSGNNNNNNLNSSGSSFLPPPPPQEPSSASNADKNNILPNNNTNNNNKTPNISPKNHHGNINDNNDGGSGAGGALTSASAPSPQSAGSLLQESLPINRSAQAQKLRAEGDCAVYIDHGILYAESYRVSVHGVETNVQHKLLVSVGSVPTTPLHSHQPTPMHAASSLQGGGGGGGTLGRSSNNNNNVVSAGNFKSLGGSSNNLHGHNSNMVHHYHQHHYHHHHHHNQQQFVGYGNHHNHHQHHHQHSGALYLPYNNNNNNNDDDSNCDQEGGDNSSARETISNPASSGKNSKSAKAIPNQFRQAASNLGPKGGGVARRTGGYNNYHTSNKLKGNAVSANLHSHLHHQQLTHLNNNTNHIATTTNVRKRGDSMYQTKSGDYPQPHTPQLPGRSPVQQSPALQSTHQEVPVSPNVYLSDLAQFPTTRTTTLPGSMASDSPHHAHSNSNINAKSSANQSLAAAAARDQLIQRNNAISNNNNNNNNNMGSDAATFSLEDGDMIPAVSSMQTTTSSNMFHGSDRNANNNNNNAENVQSEQRQQSTFVSSDNANDNDGKNTNNNNESNSNNLLINSSSGTMATLESSSMSTFVLVASPNVQVESDSNNNNNKKSLNNQKNQEAIAPLAKMPQAGSRSELVGSTSTPPLNQKHDSSQQTPTNNNSSNNQLRQQATSQFFCIPDAPPSAASTPSNHNNSNSNSNNNHYNPLMNHNNNNKNKNDAGMTPSPSSHDVNDEHVEEKPQNERSKINHNNNNNLSSSSTASTPVVKSNQHSPQITNNNNNNNQATPTMRSPIHHKPHLALPAPVLSASLALPPHNSSQNEFSSPTSSSCVGSPAQQQQPPYGIIHNGGSQNSFVKTPLTPGANNNNNNYQNNNNNNNNSNSKLNCCNPINALADENMTTPITAVTPNQQNHSNNPPSNSNNMTNNSFRFTNSISNVTTTYEPIAFSDLRILENVGKGATAHVQKAVSTRTGRLFAIKMIDLQPLVDNDSSSLPAHPGVPKSSYVRQLRFSVLRELHMLHSHYRSPCVLKMYEAFFVQKSPTQNALYIVTEFMDYGNLVSLANALGSPPSDTRRKQLPERVLAVIAEQMLIGLQEMHSRHHIHRDIKPTNVLVNAQGAVKLADFGLTVDLLSAAGASTIDNFMCSGTEWFMSPERIKGEAHGAASDIWSLGLTIAECAIGRFPFQRRGMQGQSFDMLKAVTEPIKYPVEMHSITAEFKDFIAECLQVDPKKRPTAEKLLTHKFLCAWKNKFDFAEWLKTQISTRQKSLQEAADQNKRSHALREKFVDTHEMAVHAAPPPKPMRSSGNWDPTSLAAAATSNNNSRSSSLTGTSSTVVRTPVVMTMKNPFGASFGGLQMYNNMNSAMMANTSPIPNAVAGSGFSSSSSPHKLLHTNNQSGASSQERERVSNTPVSFVSARSPTTMNCGGAVATSNSPNHYHGGGAISNNNIMNSSVGGNINDASPYTRELAKITAAEEGKAKAKKQLEKQLEKQRENEIKKERNQKHFPK